MGALVWGSEWIGDLAKLIRKVAHPTAWKWVGSRQRELAFPEHVTIEKTRTNAWIQGCPADPTLTASGFDVRGTASAKALN